MCRLGTLAEDARAQVRIVARSVRNGKMTATANVTSPQVDYDPRNNPVPVDLSHPPGAVGHRRVGTGGGAALTGRVR